MPAQPPKTRYELTVDLIKGIAWPLFAFFALFSFWGPLHLAMEQLPEIVNRSNTITVAGLTLKIDQNLRLRNQEPSAEVRVALAKLAPQDIETLMTIGKSDVYTWGDTNLGRAKCAALVQMGLLAEKSAPGSTSYSVGRTQLGEDTQAYLYLLISEILYELNQTVPTPGP